MMYAWFLTWSFPSLFLCSRFLSSLFSPHIRLSSLLLLAVGWAAFSYATYMVMTTHVEVKVWDPFEVLGLDPAATPAQIKKHYKVTSLKWHPDKFKPKDDAERQQAEDRFVDITKAYKVLTDEETRKNYEEYGHPDGKQAYALGIALPAWLVEGTNGNWVLLVYGIIFGLGLPYAVGRWWTRSKQYTKDLIENRTMALYFREIRETSTIRDLLEIISSSGEFQTMCAWLPEDNVRVEALAKAVIEASEVKPGVETYAQSTKFTTPYSYKTSVLLQAHILRVPVADPELKALQSRVVTTSIHLVLGMLQITLARGWLKVSMSCMEVSQILTQALCQHDPPILQLPHAGAGVIKSLRSFDKPLRMVRDLMAMPEADRRTALESLTPEQYKEAVDVARQWPFLEIPQAILKVIGDDVITPGSIVTFMVKLRLVTVGDALERAGKTQAQREAEAKENGEEVDPTVLDSKAADALLLKTDKKLNEEIEAKQAARKANPTARTYPTPVMHAPRLELGKRPFFWVIFGDINSNSIIAPPAKITGVGREGKYVRFQFQAPPRPGTYLFNIFVKSDSFLGLDLRAEMRLEVKDPSVLPPEEVEEDDISEPEEDSLAGQMALMREGKLTADGTKVGSKPSGKSKGVAQPGDTSDDTSDDEMDEADETSDDED